MFQRAGVRGGVVAGLGVLLLFVLLLAVAVGPTRVPFSHVVGILWGRGSGTAEESEIVIISAIRAPRAVMAAVAGFALAISGAIMQGLLRNPLASPYLLGVASGASAGAAAVVLAGGAGSLLLPAGAFAGAVCAAAAVFGIAHSTRGETSHVTLILAGVAVGTLFSAMTAYLVVRASGSDRALDIVFWTMGGLGRADWRAVIVSASIVLPLTAFMLPLTRELNAMALGEVGARHVGVAVGRVRLLLLGMAALATASVIAFVGTIGFVGLLVPHVVRMLIGPDHRYLLPASGLAGASLLVVADVLARTVARPAELPVGILTALFGVPFLLFLLRRRWTS